MMRVREDDGFTLVELLTVVMIIGALTTIAIPMFSDSKERAASATCFANRAIVERSATAYEAKESTSPLTVSDMVSRHYLAALPRCPSGGVYVWDSKTMGGTDRLYCSVHYAGLAGSLFSGIPSQGMDWFMRTMGGWTFKDGWLTPSTKEYQNRGMFGDPTWKDVSISTKAILNSGAGYGLYFRASTDSNGQPTGYCFQYDPGLGNKWVIRKVYAGNETGPIASASMPSGFAVYGTPHDVQVTTVGNRIIVRVDGKVVLDVVDTSFPAGQGGLRTWAKSDAQFGPISVTPATP